MTKTVTKNLVVGKWKIQLTHDIAGHDVDRVSIKGNRFRPWPLIRVSNDEFEARFPIDQPDVQVLRGIPSMWTQKGSTIYLWPSPAHEWTLEVRLTKREDNDPKKPRLPSYPYYGI